MIDLRLIDQNVTKLAPHKVIKVRQKVAMPRLAQKGTPIQVLGLSWIFGIHPMTWMGVPFFASLGIATFCLTFITLWGASLATFWSISLKFIDSRTQSNPLIRVILGTACWCGLEELCSLTDLWWTSLALTQSPHNLPILHLGQLSGPTTVSGAIVFVNGLNAKHPSAIRPLTRTMAPLTVAGPDN